MLFLLLCRYTSVNEVVVKPNPKGASSPQVQKEAEAEKVSGTSIGTQREYSCNSNGQNMVLPPCTSSAPLCLQLHPTPACNACRPACLCARRC